MHEHQTVESSLYLKKCRNVQYAFHDTYEYIYSIFVLVSECENDEGCVSN